MIELTPDDIEVTVTVKDGWSIAWVGPDGKIHGIGPNESRTATIRDWEHKLGLWARRSPKQRERRDAART